MATTTTRLLRGMMILVLICIPMLISPFCFAQTKHSTGEVITVLRPDSVIATASYSQGIKIDVGTAYMVFIAGQVAIDEQGRIVGEANVRKQTEQVLLNIKRIVENAGGTLGDVVKMTVFLTDMANAGVVREVRSAALNKAKPPTSTIVQVSRLFRPEYLLEIEAVAVIPKR